jgi:hypothetical protein
LIAPKLIIGVNAQQDARTEESRFVKKELAGLDVLWAKNLVVPCHPARGSTALG